MTDWQFDWDEENVRHLARHKITPFEAEDVFAGFHATLVTDPRNGEERFQAFGATRKGRLLTLAYTERRALIRVITGWDMKPYEEEFYVEEHNNNQETEIPE